MHLEIKVDSECKKYRFRAIRFSKFSSGEHASGPSPRRSWPSASSGFVAPILSWLLRPCYLIAGKMLKPWIYNQKCRNKRFSGSSICYVISQIYTNSAAHGYHQLSKHMQLDVLIVNWLLDYWWLWRYLCGMADGIPVWFQRIS